MSEHTWQEGIASDGTVPCRNSGCTIRKTPTNSAWQRKKGGHWRNVARESIPPCQGVPAGAVRIASARPAPVDPPPSTPATTSIPIVREPEDMPRELASIQEACCFCGKPTRMWTALPDRTEGQQVACCERCAASHAPAEVPSKADWFKGRKEPAPSPLARIREVVGDVKMFTHSKSVREQAIVALADLTTLERTLPDLMQAWHQRERHRDMPGPGRGHSRWDHCPDCRAKLEGR